MTVTAPPYTLSARVYDTLYKSKDYAGEVEKLRGLIARHAQRPVHTLLDVACGTGGHLAHFVPHYACTGVDISAEILAMARAKLPAVPFVEGDMLTFELGQQFDAITCLFSAIGYVKTLDKLAQAADRLAKHLTPGGVLIVEPWFHPGAFRHGHIHLGVMDGDDEKAPIKIARMSVSHVVGALSVMDMHHLVATPDGVQHFAERHEIGLFTHEEYVSAFEAAGLRVAHEAEGLIGRGLYLGVKPS
jgi:SAM-dependent methyltransferase